MPKTPNLGSCLICGASLLGKRPDAKLCDVCRRSRRKSVPDKVRYCKNCGTEFRIEGKADANRKYCSRQCSRQASEKRIKTWHFNNPNAGQEYAHNRTSKNPGVWKEKYRSERDEMIEMLGGACVVCGETYRPFLHIDYIPTTRGKPSRHPRHPNFVREHIEDFRILCANHHYELTLTGHIEGTEIYQ